MVFYIIIFNYSVAQRVVVGASRRCWIGNIVGNTNRANSNTILIE